MNAPKKHRESDRIRAALSTHATAKRLIGILSGDEQGLGEEIKQEYASGSVDFFELANRFSGKLGEILGENTITPNSYRAILHRVLAGYKGGKIGEAFSGIFPEEEYRIIQKKRGGIIRQKGRIKRAETKGTISWTSEMEEMLMKLNSLTTDYQPGKLQTIGQIMKSIYGIEFTKATLAQKIRYLKNKAEAQSA